MVSGFAKLSRRMHMLEYGNFEMEWNGFGICLKRVLVEVRPGLGQIWVGLEMNPPTLGGVLDGFSNGEGENPLRGGGVGGGGYPVPASLQAPTSAAAVSADSHPFASPPPGDFS